MVLREGRATDEWNGVRRGYGGSVGGSELRADEAEAVREERQEHESVGGPEEPVTGRDHYQQLQTPAWPSPGLHCGLVLLTPLGSCLFTFFWVTSTGG